MIPTRHELIKILCQRLGPEHPAAHPIGRQRQIFHKLHSRGIQPVGWDEIAAEWLARLGVKDLYDRSERVRWIRRVEQIRKIARGVPHRGYKCVRRAAHVPNQRGLIAKEKQVPIAPVVNPRNFEGSSQRAPELVALQVVPERRKEIPRIENLIPDELESAAVKVVRP